MIMQRDGWALGLIICVVIVTSMSHCMSRDDLGGQSMTEIGDPGSSENGSVVKTGSGDTW